MDDTKIVKDGDKKVGMGERIAEAKRKAEQEYAEKIERSRAADVDVREFFSDEELDRILLSNELFQGKLLDLTERERYGKLATAARWMDANSIETADIKIEGISPSRPNAVVVLELHRLASLQGREAKVFAAMAALADDLFVAGGDGETVRFTLGVRDIWSE